MTTYFDQPPLIWLVEAAEIASNWPMIGHAFKRFGVLCLAASKTSWTFSIQ